MATEPKDGRMFPNFYFRAPSDTHFPTGPSFGLETLNGKEAKQPPDGVMYVTYPSRRRKL